MLGLCVAGLTFTKLEIQGFSVFLIPLAGLWLYDRPWRLRLKPDYWTAFAAWSLLLLTLGSIWTLLTQTYTSGALHDWGAYALVAGVVFLVRRWNSTDRIGAAVFAAITITIVQGMALGAYYLGYGDTGPVDLVFGGQRFSGLSDNPNQIAIAYAMLPAVLLLWRGRQGRRRVAKWLFIALAFVTGYACASGGLRSAWLIATPIALIPLARLAVHRRYMRGALYAGLLATSIAIALTSPLISSGLESHISSVTANSGNLRWQLYATGLRAVLSSPLFGWGPGGHAGLDEAHEGLLAHNLYIDWSSQTGLAGLALLLWFFWRVVRPSVFVSPARAFAAASLLLYAVGGFPIRHPVVWIFILGLFESRLSSPRTANRPHPEPAQAMAINGRR